MRKLMGKRVTTADGKTITVVGFAVVYAPTQVQPVVDALKQAGLKPYQVKEKKGNEGKVSADSVVWTDAVISDASETDTIVWTNVIVWGD